MQHYKQATMAESTIHIEVKTDENYIPEAIGWKASSTGQEELQQARAMMLAFWEPSERTALRIDLWTKDMKVEEMADFFYQTMMTMADTYGRATQQNDLVDEVKTFARGFIKKFQEKQQAGEA